MQVFIVALGGALGASARYGLSLLPGKWDFPVWTFLTNLCGAVIIGFLAGILRGKDLETAGKMGAVCGAFATQTTGDVEGYPDQRQIETALYGLEVTYR